MWPGTYICHNEGLRGCGLVPTYAIMKAWGPLRGCGLVLHMSPRGCGLAGFMISTLTKCPDNVQIGRTCIKSIIARLCISERLCFCDKLTHKGF